MSKYHSDRHVKGRMGETRKKGKEYYLIVCCRFGVVEFLRWRISQETVGQVWNLVLVEFPSK